MYIIPNFRLLVLIYEETSETLYHIRFFAEGSIAKDGGRYWTRTSDPYRVKVML